MASTVKESVEANTIRFLPILSDILPATTEMIAAPINNEPAKTPVASAA